MSPRKSEEDIIKIKFCTLQFQIIGERSLNKKGGGGGGGGGSNRKPKKKKRGGSKEKVGGGGQSENCSRPEVATCYD